MPFTVDEMIEYSIGVTFVHSRNIRCLTESNQLAIQLSINRSIIIYAGVQFINDL